MLKLTVSFCRYLKLNCKNVSYRTHVRQFTQLKGRGIICGSKSGLCTRGTNLFTVQQFRLLPNKNKKLCVRIPTLKTNDPKKFGEMGETFQPSVHNVSYGGQFQVSTSSNNNERDSDDPQAPLHIASGSTNNSDAIQNCSDPSQFRVWESVKRSNYLSASALRFTVVSYNVLAQSLLECHPYLYACCARRNLKWKVRAARIYDEIIAMSPDIICLQEVQASHLNSFYSKFERIGYLGIFKQKTGNREDGCAIYYKRAVFKKIEHCSVEFYQPGLSILNRDNVGIMVKLAPRNMSARTQLVVATTHLLYNPKRADVRLAQIQVMLAELDRFAFYNNGTDSGHLPIILTGDFNSTPDSAVIELLDRGHVSTNGFHHGSDCMRIGVTDNCQHLAVYIDRLKGRTTDLSTTTIYNSEYCSSTSIEGLPSVPSTREYAAMFNSGMVGHFLNLVSVYNKCKIDGVMEASTFQDYWVTVDYIYFSRCSALKLLERLRLPTVTECQTLGHLPNDVYGSDHLSLAAVFELKPLVSSL